MSELLAADDLSPYGDNVNQRFAHACYSGDLNYVRSALLADAVNLHNVRSSTMDQSTDYYLRLTAYGSFRHANRSHDYKAIVDEILVYCDSPALNLTHDDDAGIDMQSVLRFFLSAVYSGSYYAAALSTETHNQQEEIDNFHAYAGTPYETSCPYIDAVHAFDIERNGGARENSRIADNVIIYRESNLDFNRYDLFYCDVRIFASVTDWASRNVPNEHSFFNALASNMNILALASVHAKLHIVHNIVTSREFFEHGNYAQARALGESIHRFAESVDRMPWTIARQEHEVEHLLYQWRVIASLLSVAPPPQ